MGDRLGGRAQGVEDDLCTAASGWQIGSGGFVGCPPWHGWRRCGLPTAQPAVGSGPTRSNVWLTSEQHLDINFNPASLLSIGDALAFMRDAQGERGAACSVSPSSCQSGVHQTAHCMAWQGIWGDARQCCLPHSLTYLKGNEACARCTLLLRPAPQSTRCCLAKPARSCCSAAAPTQPCSTAPPSPLPAQARPSPLWPPAWAWPGAAAGPRRQCRRPPRRRGRRPAPRSRPAAASCRARPRST